jgi:hypothetical protein
VGQEFSKVPFMVFLYSKYTRAMTFSQKSGGRGRPASAGDRRPAHAAHGKGSLSTVELGEPWRTLAQAALPPAAPGPDKDLRGRGRVEDGGRGGAAEGGGEAVQDGERDAAKSMERDAAMCTTAAMSTTAGATGEGSVRAPPAAGLEGGAGVLSAATAAAMSAALDARMLELTRKHDHVQILQST